MSEETKKAPAIRFQGFTDDWEQRKFFDNIQNTIDFRGRTPKKLGMDWSESGYLALSALNVKNGYIDPSADAHYGDGELYKKWMGGRELRKGQVLFTTEAPMGNVAQVPDNQGYILSQRTITFDVNDEKITDDFLAVLLRSPNVFNDLSALASGGTAKGVSQKSLSGLKVIVPRNLCEQQKIGLFFKQLDSAIALHLCKQRQLGLLKQRLIKEILPQSDSTLPHLRFANFRKPWEQHQLKEVLKVNSGRDYKHLNEGNIPVYGTGGYMLSVDGKLSDVDGIGLGRKGTIDKPQYLKAPFWTVDTLFYLTPSPNYDIYFLYTLIQNVNWKSMDESTGVPSLSKSVIERVTLTFPILEEQQKIGSFFREFDNTISLHQQKIAHLKALKSTILNKMFI